MRSAPRPLAAVVLLLAGCASNHYCLGEKDYQHAESRPPLQAVDGLNLPESASALRIPPPLANPVPFGRENSSGDGVCLDRPPTMSAVPARS